MTNLLPGPMSSQLGMAIGAHRAGVPGAVAAWLGFTLPSAVLMTALALVIGSTDVAGAGWVHGLELVAVPVVLLAVLAMRRTLAPDRARLALAVAGLALALGVGGFAGQLAALVLGAAVGLVAFGALARAPELNVRSAAGAGSRSPAWRPSAVCCSGSRRSVTRPARRPSRSSRRWCGRGRSCSAAATSCCRSSIRHLSSLDGSPSRSSLPGTGSRRRCPGRSSRSPRTSARSRSLPPTVSPAPRSRSSRSTCRRSSCSAACCRSGRPSGATSASRRRSSAWAPPSSGCSQRRSGIRSSPARSTPSATSRSRRASSSWLRLLPVWAVVPLAAAAGAVVF